MKKASDILKEMAFNKDSASSTQDAFLKNLRKHLNESTKGEVIPIPDQKKGTPEQLEFNLEPTSDQSLYLKRHSRLKRG